MARTAQTDLDALTDEAVLHLQELLRLDTTNPPGNETRAVNYLAEVLRREGYEPVTLESGPGRGNLVVRYRGTGEREPLLLYGHVDVVTAEPQHWSHGPFSGDLADGCVWGRGALDMKSMVAHELMIMLLLQRSGVRLKRDVIFAATADEEAGGEAGIGYLVDHHPELIQAEYGLSEGGGTTMYIAGRAIYDVRTGEKGTCRFKVHAFGEPGHGSIPRPETAVSRAAEAVTKLVSTPLPFRPTATFTSFFATLTDMLHVPGHKRALTESNVTEVLGMLPPALGRYLYAITRDTATPTGLRAGSKINVIPTSAEVSVDGRFLPGQTEEGFLAEVREVIGEGYEIEQLDTGRPQEDPPGGPLYDTIISVMRRYDSHATVLPMMMSGATDARHVSRLGTRCLGFDPVRISENFPAEQLVHGHDERIPIDGYVWGLRALYDIVTEFCLQ
jgi:acetylornithine deacetylase/succinyl-diaminopimelate desuccinylase-like protein